MRPISNEKPIAMAEPLSITSGVAGFLSLGIQVTQSLVDFYTTYKSQASDLSKTTQNLGHLLRLFESLDRALQSGQPQAQTVLQEIEKVTQECTEIIIELQSQCQACQKESDKGIQGRIQIAGRRAIYPFRKSTLQRLEEDISELRGILQLALKILSIDQHNELRDDVLEVKSLIERLNASQVSSTIRIWLKAPDATIKHNNACDKRHDNTNTWFVNGSCFHKWLVERNSFLWVNGFAGSGKSILFSTAVQHTFYEVQHNTNVGIGFFYFDFSDDSKGHAPGMISALLVQLSAQMQNGEEQLKSLHEQYKTGTPPVEALLLCLQRTICQFSDTYILIDALDESQIDSERKKSPESDTNDSEMGPSRPTSPRHEP